MVEVVATMLDPVETGSRLRAQLEEQRRKIEQLETCRAAFESLLAGKPAEGQTTKPTVGAAPAPPERKRAPARASGSRASSCSRMAGKSRQVIGDG